MGDVPIRGQQRKKGVCVVCESGGPTGSLGLGQACGEAAVGKGRIGCKTMEGNNGIKMSEQRSVRLK
jgi:hypothetical protein